MKQLLTILASVLFCQSLYSADKNSATFVTGDFKTAATIVDLLGTEAAQKYAPILAVDETIEWQVYVPPEYDPTKPAGLLVYVSPQNSGRIRQQWKDVMAETNLIWVAANQSGNKVSPGRRIVYSLMAVSLIAGDYKINQARVYISGFSGGGRIASMVASKYPGLFKGAIYICGVNYWDSITTKSLARVKDNRYVFVTGSEDFNLRDTKRVFRRYEKAGVEQLKLMVIPRMGHSTPEAGDYQQAIEFLDDAHSVLRSISQP